MNWQKITAQGFYEAELVKHRCGKSIFKADGYFLDRVRAISLHLTEAFGVAAAVRGSGAAVGKGPKAVSLFLAKVVGG